MSVAGTQPVRERILALLAISIFSSKLLSLEESNRLSNGTREKFSAMLNRVSIDVAMPLPML
jgi:hypothetical protein